MEISDAARRDKKFEDGRIRFVVTPKLGSAHISHDVTMEDIAEAIAKL
jgi:3-dehydroquinate synthetase